MAISLNVDLGTRSYPIHIGAALLDERELLVEYIRGRQLMIVTNDRVAPLYLDKLRALLDGYQLAVVVLPDGEQYKTLGSLERIITALLEHRFNRDATLLALGGGVVGDITGFAAASYQRGIDFIQLPTTLLAQVDASVGGKTAVNHPLGKNMIGAFYQPQCVIADLNTLNTLDDRELSAGLAEVIKYGLIRDSGFFAWLEGNMELLLSRDPAALAHAIERSCRNKAELVAADEREHGLRALLNLGHTFGHAIEAGLGYGQWLHGEAVGAGMVMAADLSCRLGWLNRDAMERTERIVAAAQLPVACPDGLDAEQMRSLMSVDKKSLKGQLRLVLLRAVGEAVVTGEYDEDLLTEVLKG